MKPLIHNSLDSRLGRICIDLDDFDRIVELLRRHCRSVQIVAQDVMISDSSQFQGLLKNGERAVRHLEIEAHDPFLRIKFSPVGSGDRKWATGSEVVSDPEDALGQSLRLRIEVILDGARRRGPSSMLAGLTNKERTACLIAGLIAGLIIVVPLLLPAARSLVIDLETVTILMSVPLAIMMILWPCAPVLLVQRGRVTGRTKLAPKPDPVAEP
jgi:hypothetical protein